MENKRKVYLIIRNKSKNGETTFDFTKVFSIYLRLSDAKYICEKLENNTEFRKEHKVKDSDNFTIEEVPWEIHFEGMHPSWEKQMKEIDESINALLEKL